MSPRKHDYDALQREYIFDSTPGRGISLTELAEKHGIARSLIADRAVAEGWTKKRQQYREALGVKTMEAMADRSAATEVAAREGMIALGLDYMKRYKAALEAGEIKLSTRDMIGMAAMIRTLMQDATTSVIGREEKLIDPDAIELEPEDYRRALVAVERLAALSDGSDDAVDLAPTGTEGSGED